MSTFNIESYLTQLREVVGNNEEKIAKLQLELDNTRASNVDLNQYIVALRDTNTTQANRIMELKAQLKENQSEVSLLNTALTLVGEQYNKGLETEKAAHLDTHKEVTEVVKQYEETITTLKLERDEYAARFVEVQDKLEEENEKYQRLCVDIDSLKADYRDLEARFDDEEQHEESKLRIEELEEQAENDKVRIERLTADRDSRIDNYNNVSERLKYSANCIGELRNSKHDLETKLAASEATVQRLTQKIASIREASDEAMIKVARIRFNTANV